VSRPVSNAVPLGWPHDGSGRHHAPSPYETSLICHCLIYTRRRPPHSAGARTILTTATAATWVQLYGVAVSPHGASANKKKLSTKCPLPGTILHFSSSVLSSRRGNGHSLALNLCRHEIINQSKSLINSCQTATEHIHINCVNCAR